MAHDRNFRFDQASDQLEAAFPALNFYGFGAAFLDQADGVADGFFDGHMETAVGHIGDQQSAMGAAANGAGVMQDLLEGDGKSAVVAEDHHADRIANE